MCREVLKPAIFKLGVFDTLFSLTPCYLARRMGAVEMKFESQMVFLVMGLFSLLFGSCSKPSSQQAVSEVTASKFRAGQVWNWKTPPDQTTAKLIVLRVEDGGKLGTIVHVALSGVTYGNGQTKIQHIPFAESAVEQSVTTLERESGSIPDFSEGYGIWREAFNAGKAGVFSITVAEAFHLVTNVAHKP